MSDQAGWWESFFPEWAEVQRQAKGADATRAEADYIEELLELPPQSRILDVPCGSGRLSLALAELGYRVTGVDITRPFLDEARQKAAESQLTIEWEHRDMRDLPWQERFDGAFCYWGSFGYFDDPGNADFLRAVRRALKPGARFLLETHVAESLLPRFNPKTWERVGEMLVIQERRYDVARSRIDETWTFVRDGQITERTSSIRIYTCRELFELLEETGFEPREGYETLTENPFQLGASRLLVVAVRRE